MRFIVALTLALAAYAYADECYHNGGLPKDFSGIAMKIDSFKKMIEAFGVCGPYIPEPVLEELSNSYKEDISMFRPEIHEFRCKGHKLKDVIIIEEKYFNLINRALKICHGQLKGVQE